MYRKKERGIIFLSRYETGIESYIYINFKRAFVII